MKLSPVSINIKAPNSTFALLFDIELNSHNEHHLISENIDHWRDMSFAPSIGRAIGMSELHITLNYIGEIEEQKVLELDKAMEAIEIPNFTINMNRLGFFAESKTLYLGTKKTPKELTALNKTVKKILNDLDIPSENEKYPVYIPHITLFTDCIDRPAFPKKVPAFKINISNVTLSISIPKNSKTHDMTRSKSFSAKFYMPVKIYRSESDKNYYDENFFVGSTIRDIKLKNEHENDGDIFISKDKYEITTVPRERTDGKHISWKPKSMKDFNDIKTWNEEKLLDIGMVKWGGFKKINEDEYTPKDEDDEWMEYTPDDNYATADWMLWLFPKDWFPYIPEGLEYVDINGKKGEFKRSNEDDDSRYGMLSIGFIFPGNLQ